MVLRLYMYVYNVVSGVRYVSTRSETENLDPCILLHFVVNGLL